jgi:hypothetical protein
LGDIPAALAELLAKLFLVLDRAGIDDASDRPLPLSFVGHGGE